MKILTLDTSSGTACAGVVETDNERILSEAFVDVPLTHSQTILPMVDGVLKNAGLTFNEVDMLAVCNGPGSFTGVRIGVAAAKGLGFERDLPCAGVSTLAALAYAYEGLPFDGIICAVMDARCQQVYTASFACENGRITRLTPDEAISLENCKKKLIFFKKSVIFVGDGTNLCYNACKEELTCLPSPVSLRAVRPIGIARCARIAQQEGRLTTSRLLLPTYLRLPQAERELKLKLRQKG